MSQQYNTTHGLHSPGHDLLRASSEHLAEHLPAGLVVEGSGGKGVPTTTPWIGIFDPDETASPQEGIYVVYIWSENLSKVALTLNQGITELSKKYGYAAARTLLRSDAHAVRDELSDLVTGYDLQFSLGSTRRRQRSYEAGNIASRTYTVQALPGEEVLESELDRLIAVYQEAIQVKRKLLQSQPGSISSASSAQLSQSDDPLRNFKPKDGSDYVAQLEGQTMQKSRRHERIIADYGRWVAGRGWAPSTKEHPKDLVLRRGDDEWLLEVKVVYRGNATDAVRASVGQLLTYQHFLYEPNHHPRLGALYSEPIGDAYCNFLESVGISAIWKDANGWRGTELAGAAGLGNGGA